MPAKVAAGEGVMGTCLGEPEARGRGPDGGFGELDAGGSMTILLDAVAAGAELVGDVCGTSVGWLLDCGDWLREISTAMSELTRMARITLAVRSADGACRSRFRGCDSSAFVPNDCSTSAVMRAGHRNRNKCRRVWPAVER